MSAAMQVKATLPDDDDTALLIGMLDGETEVFDLLDRLAESAIADKLLAERATERAKRIEQRAERSRDVIRKMLDALELQKLERPVFTASIGYRTKAIVTDQAALPADLLRTAPDMHAIARALKDGAVAGAELSNPVPVLTLRTT
jgi:hypothetical protein